MEKECTKKTEELLYQQTIILFYFSGNDIRPLPHTLSRFDSV